MKKLITFLLCMLLIIVGVIIYNYNNKKYIRNFNVKLSKTNNLMIVAHPDDETIWGGSKLLDGDYLVVCVTCGHNKIRNNEFLKVMEITKNKYVMLNYPDKTNGVRNNWENHYELLEKDITLLVGMKNWEMIVTHNPDGEYGHIHHKLISEIVTNVSDINKLYYFGKYYKAKEIDETKLLKVGNFSKKEDLINVYKSQKFIKKKFGHMFKYEKWVKATDWDYKT